ncbi:hypothetical protein ACFLU6_02475 [Acidobacteriota bacterium]
MTKKVGLVALLLVSTMIFVGCFGGKDRTQILTTVEDIKAEQQTMKENQEVLLKNQKEAMQTQDQMMTGVQTLLSSSQRTVTMQQNILSLVTDTNSKVTNVNSKMGSLEGIYREIYGLGFDVQAAVGETRMVVEVNNTLPLKVHAEIPKADMAYEPIAKLPVGALIFGCQKVSDAWWKGVIIREGEKETIYFAVQFTEPLEDVLTPPEIQTEGETE